jgi:hypothetical protein
LELLSFDASSYLASASPCFAASFEEHTRHVFFLMLIPNRVCSSLFVQRLQVLRVIAGATSQAEQEQAVASSSPTSSEEAVESRPKRIKTEDEEEVCINVTCKQLHFTIFDSCLKSTSSCLLTLMRSTAWSKLSAERRRPIAFSS